METNLLSKLECELLNKYSASGNECIIMHPNTFKDLIKEMYNININGGNSLKYRGIDIFRSLDIPEGEFKII